MEGSTRNSCPGADVAPGDAEYQRYKAYVRSVADRADGVEFIQNKTPEHAGAIIATLFEKARQRMRIMSGALRDSAFGCEEVIPNAIMFLRRPGTSMTIVVEERVTSEHNKFLAALKDADVLGSVVIRLSKGPLPFHLAMADDAHYRFEANTNKCEAIAQFGLSDLGALNTAFAKAETDSESYRP